MWTSLFFFALIVGVTLVIHRLVKSEKKEELLKTINIAGFIVAAISLTWAAYTYFDGIERANKLQATTVYQEHTRMSIEAANREFLGPGPYSQMDPLNPPVSKADYERYQWYVGNSLFIFETILDVIPDDDEGWRNTFKGFIEDHRMYLSSDEFPCNRYSEKIKNLLKETIQRTCTNN